MTTTQTLKAQGFRCKLETISGQGYLGGDGVACYRVRDAQGNLAGYRVSTHTTARAAWAEAVQYIGSRAA